VLADLVAQQRRPDEVIVVDASDVPFDADRSNVARSLELRVLRSAAHVCRQRNRGVQESRGAYVLLCDDDLSIPPDYVRRLVERLGSDAAGAATGAIRERLSADGYAESFAPPSVRYLLFAFFFQLTVWGDVEGVGSGRWSSVLLEPVKRWYRRRGNSWSLAGWPLVTQTRGELLYTAIYGLGASLVRREWLLASPFDEGLGAHGIGDNYGVALGFPHTPGIVVLTDLEVLHHRAEEGRLASDAAYLERILALHYFMRRDRRFGWWNRVWLVWSLVGNAAHFLLRRNWSFLRRTLRAVALIATGRSPMLRARRSGPPDPATSAA
jgi:glycosyltransferase involved in cell wall biosynthesis